MVARGLSMCCCGVCLETVGLCLIRCDRGRRGWFEWERASLIQSDLASEGFGELPGWSGDVDHACAANVAVRPLLWRFKAGERQKRLQCLIFNRTDEHEQSLAERV